MLEKRRIFLLVIFFAALCLSAAPAMADFVELQAGSTQMTVTDTSGGGSTSATATIISTNTMVMSIKDNDENLLQSPIDVAPDALNANLVFTGLGGDDYTAIGSFEMYDGGPKIEADFVSTTLDYKFLGSVFGQDFYNLTVTGYLTPQLGNTSILLGEEDNSWVFEGTDGGTISLSNADEFDHGLMVVIELFMPYGSLQDFIEANGDASGNLTARIYSTPIPAAVLLGIIGLGVAGLKLRKYA